MPVRPFLLAPDDCAETLDIVGEHVTVLASGQATGDGLKLAPGLPPLS